MLLRTLKNLNMSLNRGNISRGWGGNNVVTLLLQVVCDDFFFKDGGGEGRVPVGGRRASGSEGMRVRVLIVRMRMRGCFCIS